MCKCARYRYTAPQLRMSDLPPRVRTCRPLLHVAIDFAGSPLIKVGSQMNPWSTKYYLTIFVCLVNKATYNAVVSDLSTVEMYSVYTSFCITSKYFGKYLKRLWHTLKGSRPTASVAYHWIYDLNGVQWEKRPWQKKKIMAS